MHILVLIFGLQILDYTGGRGGGGGVRGMFKYPLTHKARIFPLVSMIRGLFRVNATQYRGLILRLIMKRRKAPPPHSASKTYFFYKAA